MKIVHLDITGCKTLYDLHERIRNAFGFPEYYGRNWDAFWDFLCTETDADKVIIIGEKTLAKDFDRHLKIMHEILDDKAVLCQKMGWAPFRYEVLS